MKQIIFSASSPFPTQYVSARKDRETSSHEKKENIVSWREIAKINSEGFQWTVKLRRWWDLAESWAGRRVLGAGADDVIGDRLSEPAR